MLTASETERNDKYIISHINYKSVYGVYRYPHTHFFCLSFISLIFHANDVFSSVPSVPSVRLLVASLFALFCFYYLEHIRSRAVCVCRRYLDSIGNPTVLIFINLTSSRFFVDGFHIVSHVLSNKDRAIYMNLNNGAPLFL